MTGGQVITTMDDLRWRRRGGWSLPAGHRSGRRPVRRHRAHGVPSGRAVSALIAGITGTVLDTNAEGESDTTIDTKHSPFTSIDLHRPTPIQQRTR